MLLKSAEKKLEFFPHFHTSIVTQVYLSEILQF